MKVIPDSSFFVCFLDDLEGFLTREYRVRILTMITENFTVIILSEVESESRFKRFPESLKAQVQSVNISPDDPITEPAFELLRPLVGRGELEVIIYSYLCFSGGNRTFFIILDDGVARDLVRRLLPDLLGHMKGTVGFLGYCAIQEVLEKNDVIDFLKAVEKSKFRIDPSIITEVLKDVQSRCG